jgi:hypothetical protein
MIKSIFITALILLSSSWLYSQINIKNTKWQLSDNGQCDLGPYSLVLKSNSTFSLKWQIEYYIASGKYDIKGDTLFLFQNKEHYWNKRSQSHKVRDHNFTWKLIIRKDHLIPLIVPKERASSVDGCAFQKE